MTTQPAPDAGAPRRERGRGFADALAPWRSDPAAPALLMGIVNVTPDSFSDGGLYAETEAAVAQGRRLEQDGAAILDVGGESTRPGATPVGQEEEMRRVLPVVAALRESAALVSVDTVKPAVADAAVQAGAQIVNDVRGLQGDPELAEVAAAHGAGIVVMHNPGFLGGTKGTEGDPVAACLRFFARSLDIAARAGIPEDRIALDPGLGFGKTVEQNFALVARLAELAALGFPLLVGGSRKSFLRRHTGREVKDSLLGTLALHMAAALNGAAILRVHDVAEHADGVKVAAALRRAALRREARP